ncbi:MAG: ABC transporter permease, partial [Acidobacteria bacterium]|nr:ABC transporter permease [Acidobacteriota bacterium]
MRPRVSATFRVGLLFVAAIIALAVIGPFLVPYDPSSQMLPLRLQGPTLAHPLGLDELGRDILARLVVGARISLLVGLAVVSVSASVGLLIGAIAGYAGGWTDTLVGRVMDVLLAFPGILLSIALV